MMKFSRAISRVKWLSGEKTVVFSPLSHLTRLTARENFIILSRRESNKSQHRNSFDNSVQNSWHRFVLDFLTFSQSLKEFPALYGIRK
jgi:hypothetical protein